MRKWYTVKDMVNYALENNLKLLSTYGTGLEENIDFWKNYRENSEVYDKLFPKLFKNYRYYDQDIDNEEETIQEVTEDFIQTVGTFLMVNQKKYEELKRINDIAFTDKLLEDVDYTRQDNGSTVLGNRVDSTSSVSGQRTGTLQEQVYPFESTTPSDSSKNTTVKGQETDTDTFNKGQETDTNANTTTVHGKMGGLTKDQVIDKHLNTWNKYEYYLAIFNDIAKEFLLV